MDPAESLRTLFGGRKPHVWTLRIRARLDQREHMWDCHVRLYYLEERHAANISPEAARVLGLEYVPGACAIHVRARFPASACRVLVRRLSAALYDGDEERIRWRRME